MAPETALKRSICEYLTWNKVFLFTHDSVGIWDPKKKTFRNNRDPYRIKGVSDVLGIYKGRFLAIEVKVKGRYPTVEQKEFIARVKEEGGIGFVARSIEDVKSELAHFLSKI